MAHQQRANINHEVLQWAMVRAQFDIEELARKLRVNTDKAHLWETGESLPTVNQAKKLSAILRVPYGFLYLPFPPREEFPLPDLRTLGSVDSGPPSVDLIDTVNIAIQKQSWYEDYLRDHNAEELSFVGKYTVNSNTDDVVKDIRDTLGVASPTVGGWESYHSELIKAIEKIGVLVIRSGIVGNNTHRKLDVNEFRGFAISSKTAPLIFVNSADAPTARLFTLMHELVHIWIDASGVSNISKNYVNPQETFCNQVAGQYLVPKESLMEQWNANDQPIDNFARIASKFHVSKLVVAKRALDQDLVSEHEYKTFYDAELSKFRSSGGDGGHFYNSAGAKNSKNFSRAVVTEALRGSLLLREAGKLLGIPPDKVKRYAREIGI